MIKKKYNFLALGFLFFVMTPLAFGMDKVDNSMMHSSEFAQILPDFSLKDPVGKVFTKADVYKNGLVLVVTAPILKNKDAQERWNKYLLDAKAGSKGRFVILEDMKPSLFKGMALKGMKKDYISGREPILLIDVDGQVRAALKVAEKQTVVLVYDKSGKLVYAEKGKPTAAVASSMWKKIL